MDSFGGFNGEGEWDLCSSILSLEDLDFTPINLPQPTSGFMADAWFCSLDSITANLPSCHVGNAIDQFPFIAAASDQHHHHHVSMSIEENKMESIFSASTTDILLQEITGFSSEDKFLDMDAQTHLGDDDHNNATNSANALFHHKRKSIVVDDDHNKLINPNKKIRTPNNVSKSYTF